jgi:hypothetical protein
LVGKANEKCTQQKGKRRNKERGPKYKPEEPNPKWVTKGPKEQKHVQELQKVGFGDFVKKFTMEVEDKQMHANFKVNRKQRTPMQNKAKGTRKDMHNPLVVQTTCV